jgi:hypothetical protein
LGKLKSIERKVKIVDMCRCSMIQLDGQYELMRGTATERGYNWNWHKVRNIKLSETPLCERCEKNGKVTIAVLVHHRDRNPRNNMGNNLESLCVLCHEKEHKEDRRHDKNMQKPCV